MRLVLHLLVHILILYVLCVKHVNLSKKGSPPINSSNGKSKSRNMLIVSTIDGTIRALDETTGEDIWKLEDDPLVSQSIANLEILDNGQMYRLVPSLEGGLFLVDSTAMRPLPITADSLLASSFQLADNSLLVGAQENDLIAVDPETGKVLFSCSKEGCGQAGSTSSGAFPQFRLVVRRRRHIVRSVDVQSGAEKWNFSMGHNEVAAMVANDQAAPVPPKQQQEEEAISYTFNVHQGFIVATQRNPFTRLLWRRELDASLHKVWRLSRGALRQLPVLSPGDPLTGALVPKGSAIGVASSCPHEKTRLAGGGGGSGGGGGKEMAQRHYIYFGHYKGQLYVQMEDRSGLEHAYPLPPAPSKGSGTAPVITGDGPLAVRRAPFRQPPAGFYVAASPGSGIIPHNNLAGLIAGESESLSVEAFGLAGNPTSWWFQSLVLGLFIFVVAHLMITRVLHQSIAEAEAVSDAIAAATVQPVAPPTPGQSEAAEKGELLLAGAPVQELDQRVVIETKTDHLPDSATPSSGVGRTLSSSASSTTDLLRQAAAAKSTFESRYANEYTHVGCLGRGGFGVVFEAVNEMDGCAYAIKRVCVRDSEENRERLTREVKALARLDHSGIVRYFMAWIERPPAGWQEERDKADRLLERHRPGDFTGTDGWEEEEESSSQLPTQSRPVFSLNSSQLSPRRAKRCYSDSVEIIFAQRQSNIDEEESSSRFQNQMSRLSDFSEISSSREEAQPTEDDDDNDDEEGQGGANVRWRPGPNRREEDTSVEIVFQRPEEEEVEEESADVRSGNAVEAESKVSVGTSSQTSPRLYLYIAMQLCATESLKHWLEKNLENRQRSTVLDMFAQIVDAVGYVHRTGMMHRDLKPSNIFFSLTDGRLKIGDFGLAASLADEDAMYGGGRRATGSSSRDSCSSSPDDMGACGDALERKTGRARGFRHTDRVGTRLYMSPELEEGEDYDSKVDIFSLGLIFLELLVPFGTHMERVQTLLHAKKGSRPTGFDNKNPREAEVITAMLHRDPAQRPMCDEVLGLPLFYSASSRYRTFSQSRMTA